MANANTRLDAVVKHQIGMLRVSENVARKMIAVLNQADKDIVAKIIQIDPSDVINTKARQLRLERLLEAIGELNASAYSDLTKALKAELRDVANYEVDFQERLFQQGTNHAVARPVIADVYAATVARPFQGRLLKEMYKGIEASAQDRLRAAIRMGFLEGESVADVVKRIRGTKANQYRDGILDINRKSAYRVARTAVAHTAAVARDASYEVNADIMQGEIWTSVLDGRTSPLCRARSGKLYDKKHKPVGHDLPWGGGPGALHFACRSTSVAVLEGEKPPDMLTYDKWLRRQDAETQKDILGPSRYRLWKDGSVSLDKFEERGKVLTLDQLRDKESAAFEKASL